MPGAAKKEPVHCYSIMQATDASEIVTIVRDLALDDNSKGAANDWDPLLTVTFGFAPSELHVDDVAPVSDGIEFIRASDLYRLAEILPEVVRYAQASGVMPPRLTDKERLARYRTAHAERERLLARKEG